MHELGHFMAARHCGIHVEEFSIGFGQRLWSKTKNGTTYSIRLLPLGGYNLFSTPPPEDDDEAEEGRYPRNRPAKRRFFRWQSAARSLRMPPPDSAFLSRSAAH